jgi:hypothetical protein
VGIGTPAELEARGAELVRLLDRLMAYLDVSTYPGSLVFREGTRRRRSRIAPAFSKRHGRPPLAAHTRT